MATHLARLGLDYCHLYSLTSGHRYIGDRIRHACESDGHYRPIYGSSPVPILPYQCGFGSSHVHL